MISFRLTIRIHSQLPIHVDRVGGAFYDERETTVTVHLVTRTFRLNLQNVVPRPPEIRNSPDDDHQNSTSKNPRFPTK